MYPSSWKFAEEVYRDATERPFGYLFVDLKPDQDEGCRLRTNIFSRRNAVCICEEVIYGKATVMSWRT